MFTPRLLSRVVSSSVCSSSSLLASSPNAAAALTSAGSVVSSSSTNSHRWLTSSLLSSSSSSTSSSSSCLVHSRRSFSTAIPSASVSSGAEGSSTPFAPISNTEVQTLLNRVEEGTTNIPDRLTANQYQQYLKQLETVKANLPALSARLYFLSPNRQDPTVNNAILELYSEAFESNWTEEQRKNVSAYLEQEFEKGGDAALVVGINKLLEKRVTIHSIINSLGGWYPLAGLATLIALSKEIIIVNEELLMVTNFLFVFAGVYLAAADSVVEQYRAAKDAVAKKFYEHRKLEIDINKSLLASYEKNPKIVALLEELKSDVNRLINERSRSAYLKKIAEIQKHYLKALDSIAAIEAQAEGKVKQQILDRFDDYMHLNLSLKRINPGSFFQDGLVTAVTELLTGKPIKPENTPIGLLVKQYIEGSLWSVDWKNLKVSENTLKNLGIHSQIKVLKAIQALDDYQQADIAKFQKENPKATKEDYFKARGGQETIESFLKKLKKNDPQKIKEIIAKCAQDQKAWSTELKKVLQEAKERKEKEKFATAQSQTQTSGETKTKPTRTKEEIRSQFKRELERQTAAFKALETRSAANPQ